MKTYKSLYPKLCSEKNIALAFKKAQKRKSTLDRFLVMKMKPRKLANDFHNNIIDADTGEILIESDRGVY